MLVKTIMIFWSKEARDVAVAALTANNKGFAEFATLIPFEDIEETLCHECNSDLVNSNGLDDNVIEFPPPRPRDVL
jgi:hypothetical protein